MDAVVAVGRLALGPLEFVRRIWHVAVRGSLIGLPGSPATQRLVGVVKRAPYLGEALVSCVFEPAARLRSPQLVFLGNQFFDPIKDGLFFHTASIVRQDRRLPTTSREAESASTAPTSSRACALHARIYRRRSFPPRRVAQQYGARDEWSGLKQPQLDVRRLEKPRAVPDTTGNTNNRYSSTSPAATRVWTSCVLPVATMSRPGASFSACTSSTTAPWSTVEYSHPGSSNVLETTYLSTASGAARIRGISRTCCGRYYELAHRTSFPGRSVQ